MREILSKEKAVIEALTVPSNRKKNTKRQKVYFFRASSHHFSPRVTNFTSESIHVPIRQVQKSNFKKSNLFHMKKSQLTLLESLDR